MSITIEIADLTLPSLPATTTGSNDAQVHGDEQRSETSANEAVPEVSAPVECERSIKRIDDHPRGFPQLAALINADVSLVIYREFSYLRNRLLLDREIELAQLEKALMTQDDELARTCPKVLSTRIVKDVCDEPSFEKSRSLMNTIYNKLKEYDDLISRMQMFLKIEPPAKRNRRSFINWVSDENPLYRNENKYLENGEDFIALADLPDFSWLDLAIGRLLDWGLPRNSILTDPEQRLQSDDEYLHLRSGYRINILTRLVLTFIIVALLIVPTSILFLVKGNNGLKFFVVSAFTILFAGMLHVGTKAKRQEIFAGTAAYCAVLVVFLGNVVNS